MTFKLARSVATLLATLFPAVASAHTGAGDTSGFVYGFTHPILGLDHVLAMVMVGVIAYQLGGRALWAVPSAFVLFMTFGGWLGMIHATLPSVEAGIALSVVALGSIVAWRLPLSTTAAVATVGLFAVFHGYAHGREMPEDAGGVSYAAGFAIATALLHVSGILAIAKVAKLGARIDALFSHTTGALVALAGIGIFAGLI